MTTQPVNLLQQTYAQTGQSKKTNEMGMREMQARAYGKRDSQYLLIKSPPASGKSRAMMFLALDKLINQGIDKVIITVPEMSIGKSFKSTALSDYGFFADWQVGDRYNLCLNLAESDARKTQIFTEFMTGNNNNSRQSDLPQVLVCTHHSFRYGFDKLMAEEDKIELFDKVLIGIDEFHHVSADESNRLGAILDTIINQTSAHIIAMTGSYFRGDSVPILTDSDEERFDKVTYTYYEQLNGYEYLKSLGLGYHFYKKSFFDALKECLDTTKKTIIHIPNVNSLSAEIDKYETVGRIIDIIGTEEATDTDTGIKTILSHDGRRLLVADLVTDDATRVNTQRYLANITSPDDMDIIIALGMAKEGFDWEYCEHVLTIGYRGSLTEVVQIIGRATRDSKGKTHAQFTNLIAQPDASKADVTSSVNDLLKAITLSLLMEQVLKPNVNFKRRSEIDWLGGESLPVGTVIIDDSENRPSDRVMKILNQDKDELLAQICQKPEHIKAYLSAEENHIEAEAVSNTVIPSIIRTKYPQLDDNEIRQVQEGMMQYMTINSHGGVVDGIHIPDEAVIEGERVFIKQNNSYIDIQNLSEQERSQLSETLLIKERYLPTDAHIYNPKTNTTQYRENNPSNSFVKVGSKFINVNSLPINLVKSVNPFHDAYEVLSQSVDKEMLKTINDVVKASRSTVTEEEALLMWPKIRAFIKNKGVSPSEQSNDPIERRMAEIIVYVRHQKAKRDITSHD
ncbi:DEAD/DEAH box helicase [Psychrobacter sp. I-STPA6b]|uniref:DEAD/DEAH box helicase n=1 Tax=Psychrobacter sp. I-STPA6b TaxID=2585718 RepID=UPI001D0CD82B|nr:DEAD/DEAH box helicase family protein [Psychrobacter sp. I-STPA6b]